MTTTLSPVQVRARLDPTLNRWLWLVKWLLIVPHLFVLMLLWIAFTVLTIGAFFGILFTGRYPRALFDFNVGVLRWTWRVAYYAYGALATDRYPPFTLEERPDDPATLQIKYPERLSRGLIFVKWLLALPHLVLVAIFIGGGSYAIARTSEWALNLGGLVGLLALVAGVALLFTGRYPQGLFDLILGLDRWVLRVAAYVGLVTDAYPPFRLDMGGGEPAVASIGPKGPAGQEMSAPPSTLAPTPPPTAAAPWSAGRILTIVGASLLILVGSGVGLGGVALTAVDASRDNGGQLTAGQIVNTQDVAAQLGPVDLSWSRPVGWTPGSALGRVQVTSRPLDSDTAIFIGIGPDAQVAQYLSGVATDQLLLPGASSTGRSGAPSGRPLAPPATQTFWAASAVGPGTQSFTWDSTPGSWRLVVMNADGTAGVRTALTVGADAPVLPVIARVLLTVGGLLLLVGVAVVVIAVQTRRTAAPSPSGPVTPVRQS